jgi:hypothetical protein
LPSQLRPRPRSPTRPRCLDRRKALESPPKIAGTAKKNVAQDCILWAPEA